MLPEEEAMILKVNGAPRMTKTRLTIALRYVSEVTPGSSVL
jgi:hypothetical protein